MEFAVITPDKGGVNAFAGVCLSVCLSVCLLARLLKNACMDLEEMLGVVRLPRSTKDAAFSLPAMSVTNLPRNGAAVCITLNGLIVDNTR